MPQIFIFTFQGIGNNFDIISDRFVIACFSNILQEVNFATTRSDLYNFVKISFTVIWNEIRIDLMQSKSVSANFYLVLYHLLIITHKLLKVPHCHSIILLWLLFI